MPTLPRTCYALLRAARLLVPFVGIYLLPWLLGTVVLVGTGAFTLNQFGWPIIWGHWIDGLLWAPFMAVIVVVTLRYFEGESHVAGAEECTWATTSNGSSSSSSSLATAHSLPLNSRGTR